MVYGAAVQNKAQGVGMEIGPVRPGRGGRGIAGVAQNGRTQGFERNAKLVGPSGQGLEEKEAIRN